MTPHPAFTAMPSAHSSSANSDYDHRAPDHGLCTPRIVLRRALFACVFPFVLLAGQAVAATYTVTNLNDSGSGSLRAGILAANVAPGGTVVFSVLGTINLSTPLPAITSPMTIDATAVATSGGQPMISVNFNNMPGITVAAGANGSTIRALSLVRALNAGITLQASKVTVQSNYIGLLTTGVAAGNLGDGVKILAGSGGNLIGNNSNPAAFKLSNVISANTGNGINISGSSGNIIAANYIGTNPAGTISSGFGNGTNGVLITGASTGNLIGGRAAGTNNPTGSKGTTTPVFQVPPQGNLISGNLADGVLINGASTGNVLSGNFIGTAANGDSALGNGGDGVAITNANNNSLIGCTVVDNPFIFYNVIAGNRGNGLSVNSSNNVTVQANFLGMGANNAIAVPNQGNGLLVGGTSQNTQVGGVIPLGNVISGNTLNGIMVCDQASGFISFNTFGGIGAFKLTATPNGLDGILITSIGGNNTVRTCIISGNKANGIEIAGNASGVQVTETSVGTTTDINGPIPNQGSGIVIRGEAHGNAIGGFQPSVEPQNFISGNLKYGIAVMDRAYNNSIFHTKIGVGALNESIANSTGGILLNTGTTGTTIGGPTILLQTFMQDNRAFGLCINNSTHNLVSNNIIALNTLVGIFAVGVCTGTSITGNTIVNNPTNVSKTYATGITGP